MEKQIVVKDGQIVEEVINGERSDAGVRGDSANSGMTEALENSCGNKVIQWSYSSQHCLGKRATDLDIKGEPEDVKT